MFLAQDGMEVGLADHVDAAVLAHHTAFCDLLQLVVFPTERNVGLDDHSRKVVAVFPSADGAHDSPFKTLSPWLEGRRIQ